VEERSSRVYNSYNRLKKPEREFRVEDLWRWSSQQSNMKSCLQERGRFQKNIIFIDRMDNLEALLISNNKEISDDIARELESNYCSVDFLFAGGVIETEQTGGMTDKNYNYVVVIDLEDEAQQNESKRFTSNNYIDNSLRLAKRGIAKTIFIFPRFSFKAKCNKYLELTNKILGDENIFAAVLFSGEIYKDSKLITGDGPYRRLIDSLKNNSLTKIEKDGKYYLPIESKTFAKIIVKKLFSISSFGKVAALLSSPVYCKKVKERVVKIYAGCEVELIKGEYDSCKEIDIELVKPGIHSPKVSINKVIDELLTKSKEEAGGKRAKMKFGKRRIQKKVQTPKTKQIGIRDRLNNISLNNQSLKRRLRKLAILAIALLLSPFFLLIINLIIFKASLYAAREGYLLNASRSIVLAEYLSEATKTYTSFLKELPLLVYTHSGIYEMEEYFSEELGIAHKGILIKVELIDGIDKLVSKKPVNIDEFFESLSLDIDYLVQDIDFFRSETKELSKTFEFIARRFLGNQIFLDKGKLKYFGDIAEMLPIALGNTGKTKYLVVLQNDAVSRASGGLIESVLLVTFEKGRLQEVEALGAEELDRRLVGVIEPPSPIVKYFNESSWYLRDANWYADFTKTAEQIEWFVDKELDEQVDGVVAINYSVLNKAIEIYGQLAIEEDVVIKKGNIDVILNSGGYENYPDSHGRRDISAVILKNMIEKAYMMKQKNKSKLLDLLFESLEEKEIQVFVHNNKLRRTLSDIGWDGSIVADECWGNCYEDYVEIIESELTESRSISTNKYASLEVSIEEGVIKRNLVIFIENIGSSENTDASENGNSYKNYIRVLIPSGAGVGMIEFISEDNRKEVRPQVFGIQGNKEIGTFVQIGQGETIAVVFSWESGTDLKMNKNGEYRLKWIKQSGTDDYPIEIDVKVNARDMSFRSTNLSLTEENRFGYNTNLSRDSISRIFWENEFKN